MKRHLLAIIGAIIIGAATVAAANTIRHDALVAQARHAHESMHFELAAAGISVAVVAYLILAAAGSMIRWRRQRRLRGVPRAMTW